MAMVQVAMVVAVVTELIPGLHLPPLVPAVLFATVVVLALPMLGRTAQFIVLLSAMATVALFATGVGGVHDIILAGKRGAFLACLILSLSFLRTAADGSPLVTACSAIIVTQPPGRRYAALLGGGHFLGVIMNFGVLNLMGPLVMQGGAGSPQERVARQRMMLAVVRGFSVAMLWSPTTLAQALIVGAVPGLRWIDLLPFSLSAAVLCAATGYLMERHTAPPLSDDAKSDHFKPAAPRSYWPVVWLGGVILLFLAAVLGVAQQADLSLIFAILPVAPAFSLLWILIDNRVAGVRAALGATGTALRGIVRGFPFQANEIVLLGFGRLSGGHCRHCPWRLIVTGGGDDRRHVRAAACRGDDVVGRHRWADRGESGDRSKYHWWACWRRCLPSRATPRSWVWRCRWDG